MGRRAHAGREVSEKLDGVVCPRCSGPVVYDGPEIFDASHDRYTAKCEPCEWILPIEVAKKMIVQVTIRDIFAHLVEMEAEHDLDDALDELGHPTDGYSRQRFEG